MILWLIFGMASAVGVSILCGTAEMSFLGAYLDQSPIFAILNVFTVWGQEGFVKAMAITFANFPDVLGSIVNAFTWNYAVLSASTYGIILRVVLTAVITIPVLVGIFVELISRLKPT